MYVLYVCTYCIYVCEQIASNFDEGTLDVRTDNIGFNNCVRTWDMTTNKPSARYLHCDKGETSSVEDSIQLALSFRNRFQLACRSLELIVFVVELNLRTMCQAREMASTWTMSVFTMWMQYTLLQEVFERFHVFNRLWVQLQKQSCKVEDILGHVLERDYVFMPTLHKSLGGLDEEATQYNRSRCYEGDQPSSLL